MADNDAQVIFQRVRFTGKRTGLASIHVKGIGRVYVGNTIEVPMDEAIRLTVDLPTRDGVASDFKTVGGEYLVDATSAAERRSSAALEPAVDEPLDEAPKDAQGAPSPKADDDADSKSKGDTKKA